MVLNHVVNVDLFPDEQVLMGPQRVRTSGDAVVRKLVRDHLTLKMALIYLFGMQSNESFTNFASHVDKDSKPIVLDANKDTEVSSSKSENNMSLAHHDELFPPLN